MASHPDIRYTRTGDVHVAYTVLGEGPDLVFAPGAASGIEWFWEDRHARRFLERLATFCRLIVFDKRGTGRSDPIVGAPTLEERSDDIRAVMDAAGAEHASIFGFSEGGVMGLMFAATHPHRVSSMIPWGTPVLIATDPDAPDVPSAAPREQLDARIRYLEEHWGEDVIPSEYINPDSGADPENRESLRRWALLGASPAMFIAMMRLNFEMDLRPILPTVQAPTYVMHRVGEVFIPIAHGRYIAEHVPGATIDEFPGADHFVWLGDTEPIIARLEEVITGVRGPIATDRVLATVLFTDVVASTEQLATMGDERWKVLIRQHDAIVGEEVERHRGRTIKSTGDGVLATFDGPSRGVRCARALRDRVGSLGVVIRAGLHTGEVELSGDDIGGIAVHIASRVSSLAAAGEVLVSRTVKDLAAGSGIEFEDRGSHELKGVPDTWQVFAAT